MRLFIALTLPEAVRRDLDRRTRPLRPRLPRAKWVRSEALHLTLAFLGETDPERLAVLDGEIAPAFAAHRAMHLRVSGAGGFPPRGKKRVLWAGLEADGDLAGLQSEVQKAAERALSTELEKRPFHAHVTLARCRPPWPAGALETLRTAFEGGLGESFPVRAGTLFESELKPAGAEYRALRQYPLREESG